MPPLTGWENPAWRWEVWTARDVQIVRDYFRDRHEQHNMREAQAALEEQRQPRDLTIESSVPPYRQLMGRTHQLICTILNAFPQYLTRWRGTTIESPGEDYTFGIRPLLYHLLRLEYLSEGRHIAICPLKECETKWFRQERAGQICCSDEHSLKYRQREYYERKGKRTKADYYKDTVRPRRAKEKKQALKAAKKRSK